MDIAMERTNKKGYIPATRLCKVLKKVIDQK